MRDDVPLPHGVADLADPRVRTVPNVITVLRTVGALACAAAALSRGSALLIVVGYLVYWVGDMADGWSARRLGQETRRGAVLDIVCDRLCTTALGIAVIAQYRWSEPAVVVFLAQFVLVDTGLSLLFLRWPLLSPNYFYLVDRVLYRWNWSPPAKATNTASVIAVTALTRSGTAGTAVAGLVLVVKLASLARGLQLIRRDNATRQQEPTAVAGSRG